MVFTAVAFSNIDVVYIRNEQQKVVNLIARTQLDCDGTSIVSSGILPNGSGDQSAWSSLRDFGLLNLKSIAVAGNGFLGGEDLYFIMFPRGWRTYWRYLWGPFIWIATEDGFVLNDLNILCDFRNWNFRTTGTSGGIAQVWFNLQSPPNLGFIHIELNFEVVE